ncbi:surface antigen BspA-like [Trichomonas vaginalis G3]|uniref:Surface antigen BspA-like n=1 Tax=Trichomonas vaginalis (strain ATCC PRA-98 / G3) TaxID=412133 RepID=A2F5M3_TRIV3|nr:ribonuclease inhibitor domain-containing protein [Trichomonas vaginalis G3]EAX99786.1 surface antigen BspA-like [Trichomonas vaginalis G3]KAI5494419.1 ribonuclease inhibitor domain-containing protein [Trichomonas vaginalis G3]|eukprot:XP_001312716.1 surface antigen BspA-like [Trichomonas vaginalis G3]
MVCAKYVEKITITSDVSEIVGGYLNTPYLKDVVLVDNNNLVSIDKVIYSANKEKLYMYPGGLEAKEFTIPDHVNYINLYAFSYVENLEKIIVGPNVKLSDGMFAFCTSLKSIEINNNTMYFPEICFAFCTNLTSIKLPDNVVISRLHRYCFQGCYSLQRLDFNNKLVIVQEGCFQECRSLVDVDFSLLYKIPEKCFKLCEMERINLHMSGNMKTISQEAFMDSKLVEFICPENLMIVEEYTFSNCTSLKNFKFNDKIAKICDSSFSSVGLDELFIPNSLMNINTSSFRDSPFIQFKFSEEGHPVYYVEGNCFMNKTGGLMFILYRNGSSYEIPNHVKIISKESIMDAKYYQFVINSDTTDSSFLYFSDYHLRICVTTPNYVSYSKEDCQMKIYDRNNVDRYAKEGPYEPTYKLNNNLYMEDSFLHVYESITDSTQDAYNVNQSLPFLESLNSYSSLLAVLVSLVSVLLVVIIILSIIALKITHE